MYFQVLYWNFLVTHCPDLYCTWMSSHNMSSHVLLEFCPANSYHRLHLNLYLYKFLWFCLFMSSQYFLGLFWTLDSDKAFDWKFDHEESTLNKIFPSKSQSFPDYSIFFGEKNISSEFWFDHDSIFMWILQSSIEIFNWYLDVRFIWWDFGDFIVSRLKV